MKAMVYTRPLELQILEVEDPKPAAGEVMVRVDSVGICGSELEGFATQSPRRKPPLIMGHEFSGVVVSAGEAVTKFKEGDKVLANPLEYCGRCEYCRRGDWSICRNRILMSMDRAGAYAEYVCTPESTTYRVPEGLPMHLAAYVEPTAVATRAVRLGGALAPQSVAVFGAGTIGLLCAQVAKACGSPKVMIVDVKDDRLASAQPYVDVAANAETQNLAKLASDLTRGAGFDVTIDAVGLSQTRADAVALCRSGGTAVWCGLHAVETTFDCRAVVLTEKTIRGTYAYKDPDFEKALDLIAAGKIEVDSWSRHFPLEEGVEQFLALTRAETDYVKAILHP